MQLLSESQRRYRDMRLKVEAAMETGNFDQARLVLTEYSAAYPAEGETLRAYIVGAYGTAL